jgi:transcriptional regulator with XRE-family HTH domain
MKGGKDVERANRKKYLKNRMYILGLTQKDIAASIGTNEATISNIFCGRKKPTIPMSRAIATILEMDEREFRALLLEAVS